jgi:hypothetical protein
MGFWLRMLNEWEDATIASVKKMFIYLCLILEIWLSIHEVDNGKILSHQLMGENFT